MSEEIRVLLDKEGERWCDVTISADTSVSHVLNIWEDEGSPLPHGSYYLAELCMGYEREMERDESIQAALQKWSTHRDKVQFLIRNKDNKQQVPHKQSSMDESFDKMNIEQLRSVSVKQLQQLALLQRQLQQRRQQLLDVKNRQQIQLEQSVTSVRNDELSALRARLEEKQRRVNQLRGLREEAMKQSNHNTTLELQTIREKHGRAEQSAKELREEVSELQERVKQSKQTKLVRQAESSTDKKRLLQQIQKENKLAEEQSAEMKRLRDIILVHVSEQRALDRKITDLTNTLTCKKNEVIEKTKPNQTKVNKEAVDGHNSDASKTTEPAGSVWSKTDTRYQSFPSDRKSSGVPVKASTDSARRVVSFDVDDSALFNENGLKKLAENSVAKSNDVTVDNELEPDMSVVSGRSSESLSRVSGIPVRSQSSDQLNVRESHSEAKPISVLSAITHQDSVDKQKMDPVVKDSLDKQKVDSVLKQDEKQPITHESTATVSENDSDSKVVVTESNTSQPADSQSRSALPSAAAASILNRGPTAKILGAKIIPGSHAPKPAPRTVGDRGGSAGDDIVKVSANNKSPESHVAIKPLSAADDKNSAALNVTVINVVEDSSTTKSAVNVSQTSKASETITSQQSADRKTEISTDLSQVTSTYKSSGVGTKMMSHFAPRPYGNQFGSNLLNKKPEISNERTTSQHVDHGEPNTQSGVNYRYTPSFDAYRQKFSSVEYKEKLRSMYEKDFDPNSVESSNAASMNEQKSVADTVTDSHVIRTTDATGDVDKASLNNNPISVPHNIAESSENVNSVAVISENNNSEATVVPVVETSVSTEPVNLLSPLTLSQLSPPRSPPSPRGDTAGFYRLNPDVSDEVDRPRFISYVPRPVRRRSSTNVGHEVSDLDKESRVHLVQPQQTDTMKSGVDLTSNIEVNNSTRIQVIDETDKSLDTSHQIAADRSVRPDHQPLARVSSAENRSRNTSEERSETERGGGTEGGRRKVLMRRVSFEPLTLLLDASLEGELEVVQRTAAAVGDLNASNEEGITALHNAICAGHLSIVKFLVDAGCDVNVADSDGWTPLHCAASCNNIEMLRYLIEHGACIFSVTISDQELAVEKCEEHEPGYQQCVQYLRAVESDFGLVGGGVVYSAYDYVGVESDELTVMCGDQITVIRHGDEVETDWWWCQHTNKHTEPLQGYVPRNLISMYPRVRAQTLREEEESCT